MIREKKQLTYKKLYKIFGVIIYSLTFLVFLFGILGLSLDNEYRYIFMNIGTYIFLATAFLGAPIAIFLAIKKEKEKHQ